jgi:hypothetical protein
MGRTAKRYLVEDGRELTAREIADEVGVSVFTVQERVRRGRPLLESNRRGIPVVGDEHYDELYPNVKVIEPEPPAKLKEKPTVTGSFLTRQLTSEAEWWEGMRDSCGAKNDYSGAFKAELYAEAYRHAIKIIEAMMLKTFLAFIFAALLSAPCSAADVTVSWWYPLSHAAQVAGWKFYADGVPIDTLADPDARSHTIIGVGLTDAKTRITMTAYDSSDNESTQSRKKLLSATGEPSIMPGGFGSVRGQ